MRPEREADYSPPSTAEAKNAWGYTSTHTTGFHGAVLTSAQGQFYLYASIVIYIIILLLYTCHLLYSN